jgi:hypothetical protein
VPQSQREIAEAAIDRVLSAQQDALANLGSELWLTTQQESARGAIRSLTGTIGAWAARGRAAADAGNAPSSGWPAWSATGTRFIATIDDLARGGAGTAAGDFAKVASEAPATSAKAIASAAKGTARAVGETAGALVEGALGVPAWLVVAAVGAGALALFLRRP